MKTLSLVALTAVLASLSGGALADTVTETTRSKTYNSTTVEPMEDGSSTSPIPSSGSMMDQTSTYDTQRRLEQERLDQQRMEDRTLLEDQSASPIIYGSQREQTTDGLNYENDRKRTNRERKAVDTSSDASDDE